MRQIVFVAAMLLVTRYGDLRFCSSRKSNLNSASSKYLRFRSVREEDVERTVIDPYYRVMPQSSENQDTSVASQKSLRILVLGEANICRSPLAAALLTVRAAEKGLADIISFDSRAVHDFAAGETLPASVLSASCQLNSQLEEVLTSHKARMWRPEWDVCDFDLLVAVDRYVAADAMKEVSVWDTIQKDVSYCTKIRGLFEFGKAPEISDPLYGNPNPDEQSEAFKSSFSALSSAVDGLLDFLASVVNDVPELGRTALLDTLQLRVANMGEFEWNAPPMLMKRSGTKTVNQVSDSLFSISEP